MHRRHSARRTAKRGATIVEMAFVLPVFFLFVFAIFEFGHAYMVRSTLRAATKRAARMGIAESIPTSQVEAKVDEVIGAAVSTSHLTIYVKDASIFDQPGVDPNAIDYDALPDIELSDAEPRQLFVVRAELPYDQVAVMPPFWAQGITLTGQTVMRHE